MNSNIAVLRDHWAAARALVNTGWLPISNKYQIIGFAPAEGCAKALAKLYNDHPNEAHWAKMSLEHQRDQLAGCTFARFTVSPAIYEAMKRILKGDV